MYLKDDDGVHFKYSPDMEKWIEQQKSVSTLDAELQMYRQKHGSAQSGLVMPLMSMVPPPLGIRMPPPLMPPNLGQPPM